MGEVVKIKNRTRPIVNITDVLLAEEYSRLYEQKIREGLGIADIDLDKLIIEITSSDVEIYRYIVSAETWKAFFLYRAFLGRSVVILSIALKEKKEPDWQGDGMMRQIIRSAFGKEEIPDVGDNRVGFLDSVSSCLENSVYLAISDELSGRRSVEASYDVINDLLSISSAMKRDSATRP